MALANRYSFLQVYLTTRHKLAQFVMLVRDARTVRDAGLRQATDQSVHTDREPATAAHTGHAECKSIPL